LSLKTLVVKNLLPWGLDLALLTFDWNQIASAAQVILKILDIFKLGFVTALIWALKTQKTLLGVGFVICVF
jgi:hypothetical protein